ncbi:MAG TPA: glycosyltransferase, partial [Nitrososphaeraceae archaeon]|nr:glycosyltransferase [Nitrososphaeraceae archaeon]
WVYFFLYMLRSLKKSPKLESFNHLQNRTNDNYLPKVSVILPARNEEKYISKCLDSLFEQDYPNFEIIAVNDSSSDKTAEIMYKYQNKSSILTVLNAGFKPAGWIGKNWACHQGYLRANGEIFLFTDADTIHSPSVLSLAIEHLIEQKLDALTVIPRLLCQDIWTKITLPLIWSISYVKYSPLRANNPKATTGYFFGSFYVIFRKVYEAVGTHEAVKSEIVEDGALGGIVKKAKFNLRVVRGEHYVEAVWARDFSTLWHGLRRLMIPLYHQDKINASLIMIATFFLLLIPFISLFVFPFLSIMSNFNTSGKDILLLVNLNTIALIGLSSAIQSKYILFNSSLYSLASPIAGTIICLAFLSSIIDAKKKEIIRWRGRGYTINTSQHPLL